MRKIALAVRQKVSIVPGRHLVEAKSLAPRSEFVALPRYRIQPRWHVNATAQLTFLN